MLLRQAPPLQKATFKSHSFKLWPLHPHPLRQQPRIPKAMPKDRPKTTKITWTMEQNRHLSNSTFNLSLWIRMPWWTTAAISTWCKFLRIKSRLANIFELKFISVILRWFPTALFRCNWWICPKVLLLFRSTHTMVLRRSKICYKPFCFRSAQSVNRVPDKRRPTSWSLNEIPCLFCYFRFSL